ncbi:MAG: WD40 repeat domain-containing protein [Candidatus Sericytochromatia bacterium]
MKNSIISSILLFFILIYSNIAFSKDQIINLLAHEAAKKKLITLNVVSNKGILNPEISVENKTTNTLKLDFSRTAFVPENYNGQRIGLTQKNKIEIVLPPKAKQIFNTDSRCLDQNRMTEPIRLKYNYIDTPIPKVISDLLVKNASQENVWKETDHGSISKAWKSLDPRNKLDKKDLEKNKKYIVTNNNKSSIYDKLLESLAKNNSIKNIFLSNNGGIIINDFDYIDTINIKQDMQEVLNKITEQGKKINSINFTKDNGWVILYDNNKFESKNIPLELKNNLINIIDRNIDIKNIVFSPNGGWLLTYGKNGILFSNFPEEITNLIEDLNYYQIKINSINFTKDYGWIIIFREDKITYKNIPIKIANKIEELKKKNTFIKNIAFSPNGDWIMTEK